MRPISEKAAELLFSRYILQAIGLRKGQLFAPSAWEERQLGFDQRLFGLSKYREINLQFKSPDVVTKWSRFKLRLDPPQHSLLQSLYPSGASFYVAHTFLDLAHVNQTQLSSSIKEARDFLAHFICVEIASLPADARSLHFERERGAAKPASVSVKRLGDGSGRKDGTSLTKSQWMRGDGLLDALIEGTVGTTVNAESLSEHKADSATVQCTPSKVAPADIGLFIQVPLQHGTGG